MIKKQTKAPELNGRTVPVERRKEVRLCKEEVDTPQEVAVTYKIASEKEELEKAYALVWNNYVETGLQGNDQVGIRFTKYHLLPDTRVFIANFHQALADQRPDQFKGDGICVGTVTLIMDSPMGLPVEELCGEEITEIRRRGDRRLAEVVAFAVDPKYTRYKVFLHMFQLLFQFAEMRGVTDICCSVTEKHSKFYRRVCFFEPLGEVKPYSAGHNVRAQGHILNIKEANEKSKAFYSDKRFDADLHRFFFSERFNSEEKGEGCALSSEFIKYFISDRTDFIDTLEDKDLSLLRDEYQRIQQRFPF